MGLMEWIYKLPPFTTHSKKELPGMALSISMFEAGGVNVFVDLFQIAPPFSFSFVSDSEASAS